MVPKISNTLFMQCYQFTLGIKCSLRCSKSTLAIDRSFVSTT